MRSSTPARTVPLRRRTPLARTVRLQARPADPVTRRTRRLVWRRSGGLCEIRISEACQRREGRLRGVSWQYSHRVRRRVSPTHGPAGGLAGCPDCHRWWEELQSSRGTDSRRRTAEACGWLIRAESVQARDPASVPVLIDGRWWLLDEDGGREEVMAP